jgi:ceramide glucosyltransferase
MAACLLFWAGLLWWMATMGVQWLSALLGRWRRPVAVARHSAADFSIVAPLRGAGEASEAYLASLADLARAGAEVLVCVADESDPALAATRARWPEAPILVGEDTSKNPKMNNVRKGLEAARRPIVVLCDAGVLLPLAELAEAAAQLSDKVGLVLALKAAAQAENFAGEVEAAYVSGHQARFLKAADRLGMAVASGGATILARQTLEAVGGHQGFMRNIADDYSVVQSVRGLRQRTTWLANVMPRMPVGKRRWSDVWKRQVRWGSTRLNISRQVRALVLFEPAIGWLASTIALVVAALAAGLAPGWLPLVVAAHTVAWFAAEAWFLAGHGMSFGLRAFAAALAREGLAPVLAFRAWRGRDDIDWRGMNLAQHRPERDGAAGTPV